MSMPLPGDGKEKVPFIVVRGLEMSYRNFVVMHDLDFTIYRGDTFIVMGESGSGKSTLLKHLVGLKAPARGEVLYDGVSLWDAEAEEQERIKRRFGTLFQSGALWSSLTLAENVALPLEQHTTLPPAQIRELVSFKLSLVGLAGFEEFYPAEISGGMRKRAGLARAMALDPDLLFFDEPSSGLDPISARLLDDLIVDLRDSLGTTIVVVTHELASIFAIGTNAIFLDPETKTITASGDPKLMLQESQDPKLISFLTRGERKRQRSLLPRCLLRQDECP
jgi:phospholipid/cholesterol/gamma-HCH transport system ATP-binding protein